MSRALTFFAVFACALAASAAQIETPSILFCITPETGVCEITDKVAGVAWRSAVDRFGEVTLNVEGKSQRFPLTRARVTEMGGEMGIRFRPRTNDQAIDLRVRVGDDERTLEFSYVADASLKIESMRVLEGLFTATDTGRGYVAVPVREGLLVPANSGLSFTQRFDTYAYEGCHIAMLGVVNDGAAALLTWDDPYVLAEVRSVVARSTEKDQSLVTSAATKQSVSPSLVVRKSARAFRVQALGKGDYVTIAKAYRELAKARGLLVTWDEKLKQNPERAKYFGASNYKLWSVLDRRMNDDSSKEERVRVNWTFDEAAQVAEHLKRDLQLDKVLFIMGGWIHRGYDNQHPDILPTAPECGGDAAFGDACKRIRALGYVLSLHDNYQDIYRDSPSWDERWIQKNAGGALTKGGHWAGGRAYITCAKMALELARRPQNLVPVKKLSNADSYFIDTTYAAGLQECFDKEHPLTRADDLRWKAELSDYARGVFGSFGSECGREWAIPHADFFEGLTGVSGGYYHNKDLVKNLGASVIPLFELVYRDCIALYGKYGYEPTQAAEYVLHHIAIGRPLHYHNVPSHLYWKQPSRDAQPLALRPSVAEFTQTGPRQFAITYGWDVEKAASGDWRVFVHFTDPGSGGADKIRFQNDHAPKPPVAEWKPGAVREGPFNVSVPDGLNGTFAVRMGLFRGDGGERALLATGDRSTRSCAVGTLKVSGDKVSFEPAAPVSSAKPAGNPGLFTRADNGWADGMHLFDRFVKNTHEILSPLNEITARMPMTKHEFLTPDRKVQHSVFGSGDAAVHVIVNASATDYSTKTKLGGEIVLPPYGFAIESPTFAAFCALQWNGRKYAEPALFTLRSDDGQPLGTSKRIKVFHGFGEGAVRVGEKLHTVKGDGVVMN